MCYGVWGVCVSGTDTHTHAYVAHPHCVALCGESWQSTRTHHTTELPGIFWGWGVLPLTPPHTPPTILHYMGFGHMGRYTRGGRTHTHHYNRFWRDVITRRRSWLCYPAIHNIEWASGDGGIITRVEADVVSPCMQHCIGVSMCVINNEGEGNPALVILSVSCEFWRL